MSTTVQKFHVRTTGAGLVRDGRIVAPSASAACRRAIGQHRSRLIELANNAGLPVSSKGKNISLTLAKTASILVTTVQVITFDVGATLTTPEDAA